MISHAGWEPDPWVDAVPVLLEPMGVRSVRVRSGSEAARLIQMMPIHVAVVDLGLPLSESGGGGVGSTDPAGGERLLELMMRLSQPPPTIAVRAQRSRREESRELAAALRAGVFAVIDRPRGPHDIETLLDVLRRVLGRFYGDCWPGNGACEGPAADRGTNGRE